VCDDGGEVGDADADVAKALGVLVAVVVGLALFELGSFVGVSRRRMRRKRRRRESE